MPDFNIEKEIGGIIGGIDEAGRGPLAGPVVAACIILDKNNYPCDINDSKKLNAKKRERIFKNLITTQIYGIGIVDNIKIDEINILNATKLAMKLAYEKLQEKFGKKIDHIIVDGNFIPQIKCPASPIIKGDTKSLSIAAASIIAKETRDQIMFNLAEEFPQYGWEGNKGYPTAAHFTAIKEFGATKYHRQSFKLIK